MEVIYKIDGNNLKTTYGITIRDSDGVLDVPGLKEPVTNDWADRHGVEVDLDTPIRKSRVITLQAFLEATDPQQLIERIAAFDTLIMSSGLKQLIITMTDIDIPLIFMVYCEEGIKFDKKWTPGDTAALFELVLIEPEPVKIYGKVTTAIGTMAVSLVFAGQTEDMLINVNWGDSVSETLTIGTGSNDTIQHTYTAEGDFYVLITGVLSGITVVNDESVPFMLYPVNSFT